MSGFNIELLGFETGEIDALHIDVDLGGGRPEPAVIAPPLDPVTRPGDLWMLGDHRLLCGSSLEGAAWDALMGGKTAKLCFSDPPYNVPVQGNVCGLGAIQHAEFAMASGEMDEAQFVAFLTRSLRTMARQLDDGAILQICMDWRHLFELQTRGARL